MHMINPVFHKIWHKQEHYHYKGFGKIIMGYSIIMGIFLLMVEMNPVWILKSIKNFYMFRHPNDNSIVRETEDVLFFQSSMYQTGSAAEKLHNFKDTLIEALKDSTPIRRRFTAFSFQTKGIEAAYALADIGASALPVLYESIKAKDPAVRGNAALALGAIKDKDAVSFLQELIKDKNPVVRIKAVMALGEIMPEEAKISLTETALNDPEPEVRAEAVKALRNCVKTENILKSIARNDEHWYVRSEAKVALDTNM